MTKTTYTLYVRSERVKYLVEKLGDKVVVKNTDDDCYTELDITITSPLDLLCLLHAGYAAGRDSMQEVVEQYKALI